MEASCQLVNAITPSMLLLYLLQR